MFARLLDAALREALADTPATFIAGARQTGKSTLVQRLEGHGRGGWTYRTFDDLGTLGAAREDPEAFVQALGPRAILDEVQRAPEVLLPLKRAIDLDRRPGRFVLTGSANVLTMPRATESLAGRMEILTLWPLARCEIEGVRPAFVDACFEGRPETIRPPPLDRRGLLRLLATGGFPEVTARGSERARARWFDAYVTALAQRDLRDLAAVERVAEVPRLLQVVAARAGSALNVADLGRTLGFHQLTLGRYLALLEALYLLHRLPPWFENLGKRLAKAPKLYLCDSGLLVHLLGHDAAGLAARPADLGPVLETFVVNELLRLAPHAAAAPRLHHLRTSDGYEVDVVLETRRRELVGIEIKASATPSTADFKGLRYLQQAVGDRLRAGVLLYAGREVLPFGPRLWAIPVSALWGERR